MANKIKQEMNTIQIPRDIHEWSKKGVLKAKSEMRGSRKTPIKYLPYLAAVVCFALLIPLGLSFLSKQHPAKSPAQSIEQPVKSRTTSNETEHIKTIQTFLKLELTGPSKEFKKALDQLSTDPSLLDAYNKKYYQPLIAKDYYQQFINYRYETFWLQPALKGYKLKPTNIEIKKEKGYYNWRVKVKVEDTGNGKTKTSIVNGMINLNNNGKIISVRFLSDDGLSGDLPN